MKKLDLGCGISKKNGFIGVDSLHLPGVDVVHDLSIFPYPFDDNEIEEIWMDNVLEHLVSPIKVVEEIYRICKKDAKVIVGVPYFRSVYAAIDPTHVNFFSANWFNYFDPKHFLCQKYQYSSAKFAVEKIEFDREWKEKGNMNFLHRRLVKIAEGKTMFYENKISHLFPLNSITFYLRVLK